MATRRKLTTEEEEAALRSQVEVWRTEARNFWQRDPVQAGLALEGKKGNKNPRWIFNYRPKDAKRVKKLILGNFLDSGNRVMLGLQAARDTAARFQGVLAGGKDPAKVKRAEGEEGKTFADVAAAYMDAFAVRVKGNAEHGKQSTYSEFQRLLSVHLLPAFGKLAFVDLSTDHVRKFHERLMDRPATATKCLKLISAIYNFAEASNRPTYPKNPTRHIQAHRSNGVRRRALTPDELARLGKALESLESVSHVGVLAVRLLALTGWRRSEICGLETARVFGKDDGALKFHQINRITGVATLPQTKQGEQERVLGASALKLIWEEQKRMHPQFTHLTYDKACVCSSRDDITKGFKGIATFAARAFKLAGLDVPGLCLHSLRHTFVSQGATIANGKYKLQVGNLVGHGATKELGITSLYMHVAPETLKPTADAVSSHIAKLLGLEGTRNVIGRAGAFQAQQEVSA